MPIKTIMSVCSPDQSDDALKAAAELCASADAHLALVVVGIAVPPPAGEYAVELSFEWQELRRRDLDGIASKVSHAAQILERYGISFDIETEYAEPAWLDDAVGLRARYCDLVYLNRDILRADDIRMRGQRVHLPERGARAAKSYYDQPKTKCHWYSPSRG